MKFSKRVCLLTGAAMLVGVAIWGGRASGAGSPPPDVIISGATCQGLSTNCQMCLITYWSDTTCASGFRCVPMRCDPGPIADAFCIRTSDYGDTCYRMLEMYQQCDGCVRFAGNCSSGAVPDTCGARNCAGAGGAPISVILVRSCT